jgi:hypothetical protein
MSLNAPIKKATVYAQDAKLAEMIRLGSEDVASSLKIGDLQVVAKKSGEGRQVCQFDVTVKIEY